MRAMLWYVLNDNKRATTRLPPSSVCRRVVRVMSLSYREHTLFADGNSKDRSGHGGQDSDER